MRKEYTNALRAEYKQTFGDKPPKDYNDNDLAGALALQRASNGEEVVALVNKHR
jgi:hypothetical protein